MRHIKKILVFVVIGGCALMSAGCVQRKLTVKSDPPGAEVYFNDRYIGQTPLDFDFEWYWEHKVELRKEGYETISNFETIKAPVYMWIPFDLVMELLPFSVKDDHQLTYTLEPEKPLDETKETVVIEKFDLSR